jgi:hypothetical protein
VPVGSSSPIKALLNPPKASAYPTKKNPTNPSPKMAKFVDTTWAACLARQNPVSTRAKPACMKTTSTAPMTTQSRLMLVPSTVRPSFRVSTVGLRSCAMAGMAIAATPTAVSPAAVSARLRSLVTLLLPSCQSGS